MGLFLALFSSVFHAGLSKLGFVLQKLFFAASPSPDAPVGRGGPPRRLLERFALNACPPQA
jgi:hypothetical protein